MIDINYRISFYSYWHAGGKDGANMEIDNAVLKDKDGLPYIGGKTLKGLIKDGATFIKNYQPDLINDEFITSVFGEEDKSYNSGNNSINENNFASAKLCEEINKKYAKLLYHIKQTTALESNKQAMEHSLRSMEVTIPLELKACIENFTGDIDMLKLSFQAIKKLGEKRFRGLGRCVFEIIENN